MAAFNPGTLLLFLFVRAALLAQAGGAFLHGTVIGPNGGSVAGVRVSVSSGDHGCDSISNAEGKFNCKLPAGRYELSASSVNFLPYRRATLNLLADKHSFVYVSLVPHAPSDQTGIPEPEIQYASRKLLDGSDVLLRFESSNVGASQVEYRGGYVELTYNDIAIRAKEIHCSVGFESCGAHGDVTAEIGAERLVGNSIQIDFSNRELKVTRDPQVTRTF